MSQSKEMTWESLPDREPREDATEPSWHDDLSLRLCTLLERRARLAEQLDEVDREIDRVRADAAEQVRHQVAQQLDQEDRTCVVSVREFVRGAAEPPLEVDRGDFERCLGKVVLALRRRGDSLARAEVEVRYQARTGRVIAIALTAADGVERQLYRRFDLGAAASG